VFRKTDLLRILPREHGIPSVDEAECVADSLYRLPDIKPGEGASYVRGDCLGKLQHSKTLASSSVRLGILVGRLLVVAGVGDRGTSTTGT
jgi:hypothetical protein